MMQKEFYSNGKLLLTGEYAVLDGALALAIPTSYGQSLKAAPTHSGHLNWVSYDESDREWFRAEFDIEELKIISTTDAKTAETLVVLLQQAKLDNPLFLSDHEGFLVETHLSFPLSWGLGTSSTLINNLAQWARVDAYELLWKAFGGSGYDIACAQHNSPLTYQLKKGEPHVEETSFDPFFKDSLFFVHLNQKQSSKEAIAAYRNRSIDKESLIRRISNLTQKMITAPNLSEFEILMEEHETILSETLGILPIKQKLFPDYAGAVKSLGAWGGDFVMATGDESSIAYFHNKGYPTVIPYSKMIL
jgi:Mevalonate kinase